MKHLARRALKGLPEGVKAKLRTAVHPAQKYFLQRAFGLSTRDLGLLSVIIPVYNVAEYLPECLNSVISQSYPHLEIVIVDDGSTDSSLQIAREYARWDKRISIIELEHGGNGVARNVGIAAATGAYLTFADSDDVVTSNAYMRMISSLTHSGSDFVVGSSDRLIGKRRFPTKLSKRLHKNNRKGISIADFPECLNDVFLWNKTFRRDFWDQHVAPIPEAVLYEDQETTARAFIRATRFDVLTEVVYSWRQRPGGSSITQGKGDLQNLLDRLKVAQSVSRLLLIEANSGAVQVWCQRLFGHDLIPYFDFVANRGDDYWEALQSGVSELLQIFAVSDSILDSTWHSIDPHARVFLNLIEAHSREGVEDVVVDRIDSGKGYEVAQENGRFVARPNYWKELGETKGLPVLSCTAGLLTFESEIRVRDLQDGRGPVLRGHAYIRGFASSAEVDSIHVLIGLADGSERRYPVVRIKDLRIDVSANDAFATHVHSGFELDLDTHPELVSATTACVELTVGDESWKALHGLNIAEALQGSKRDISGNTPTVTGIAVENAAESFSIDVDWGSTSISEEVFLSTSLTKIDPSAIQHAGGSKRRYIFELQHLAWGQQVYSYPSGAYTLRHKKSENSRAVSFRATPKLAMQTPLEHELQHSNVTAWVTSTHNFAVSIGAPLSMVQRSKYGQRQLQKSFMELACVEDHVFIESFGGGSCTDSPLALAESIHISNSNVKIYCSIVDYSVPIPSFVIPLIQGTTSWFHGVRTARLIINNNIFPFFFKKGLEQTYLQTWHGTPIKKIGTHAPRTFISASYRRGVLREADSWTGLLAQNSYSAGIFADCFDYHGQIICVGYPRNDNLEQTQKIRAKIRSTLSLTAAQVVVLVAPTWRDDLYRAGKTQGSGDLDLAFLSDRSPENYRFLLRTHQNEIGGEILTRHRKVIDVSSYPSINDLFAASDCLITDYSSLAFDYSNTGKPILAHISRESNYETIRGTYLSVSELFGSQVARSMPDLLKILIQSNSENSPSGNSSRIKKLFASMDDGGASGRVLHCLERVTNEVS